MEVLQARRRGQPAASPVVVEGAGYFVDGGRPGVDPTDTRGEPAAPALARLRERVAQKHGARFVTDAMDRVVQALRALDPGAPGFAERYQDGLTALRALEVLRDARPLRADAYAGGAGTGLALDPGEIEALATLSEALEAGLVRLIQSTRPDWGFPLLVGMARLAALDESRRLGRWMLLDVFPADAIVISAEQLARRPAMTRETPRRGPG